MSRSEVLVSADWVEQNLNTPGVVIVEVDEDTAAYDTGHITGAVKLDWKTELQDPVVRDAVSKQDFEKLLSAKGISNDDTVVLYGGNNNWFAAYAYWYFKLYGHNDVKLLDGGRKKWELEGRELSKDEVNRPATEYHAQDQDLSIRAFRDEVVAVELEVPVRVRREPVVVAAVEHDGVVVRDALGRQQLGELLLADEVAQDRVLQLGLPVQSHRALDVTVVVGGHVLVNLHEDDLRVGQVGLGPVSVDEDVFAAHAVTPLSVGLSVGKNRRNSR